MAEVYYFFKGVRTSTTKDCLFNFLRAKSGTSPNQMIWGKQAGTVMVIFDFEPGMEVAFGSGMRFYGVLYWQINFLLCMVKLSGDSCINCSISLSGGFHL